ncbi:LA2681 family HEPN domain-containing protein [Stenotrophomonas sp. TWI1409]|uniref:LA2681 family HEPN domain-containing protein n=1 Tax=unclassified Stenotrophomonas TaxID=196198 RepID=UPI003209D975
MESSVEQFRRLCERTITKLSDAEAIDHIALLVDSSTDQGLAKGANRAIRLLDQLSERGLNDRNGALSEYLRANAFSCLAKTEKVRQSWAWEEPLRQKELLALSRSASHPGFQELDRLRRCQILTNQANQLNTTGRTIDAIELWSKALSIIPRFAMASGNLGCGLLTYAKMVSDPGQRSTLALHAFDALTAATSKDAVLDSEGLEPALEYFAGKADQLSRMCDIPAIREIRRRQVPENRQSNAERSYRNWCLQRGLFLNPLNDLGDLPDAGVDELMLPPLTERIGERAEGHLPPPIVGFFNQLKQEYVSARFMLYEGATSSRVHFSDKGVSLVDTLDYPLHSLATERVRTAFRVGYSLLDKVAFLVDLYWNLGKVPHSISFRNVWMVEGGRRLLPQLEARENLPLRGLFWLSKELFDDEIQGTTAADARDLQRIRNALEHTYLRVYEGWTRPFPIGHEAAPDVGFSIGSDELEAKAVRVTKMARSALIYVSLAIGVEERRKERINPDSLKAVMPLSSLVNWRKRREPT